MVSHTGNLKLHITGVYQSLTVGLGDRFRMLPRYVDTSIRRYSSARNDVKDKSGVGFGRGRGLGLGLGKCRI